MLVPRDTETRARRACCDIRAFIVVNIDRGGVMTLLQRGTRNTERVELSYVSIGFVPA